MRIQNNIMAMNTHRQLGINQMNQGKSTEKLSSGYRINRAADDAAGLSISEKMRAQIRGLNRASANAQDAISLIQAAEGALQESHSILQRIRELAVQGANDVNAPEDREAIRSEINQLGLELDRIATSTNFNGKYILSGAYGANEDYVPPTELEDIVPDWVGALNIQVGANTLTSDVIKLNISGVSANDIFNGANDDLVWITPEFTDGPGIIGPEEGFYVETAGDEDTYDEDALSHTTFGFQAMINVIDGLKPDGERPDPTDGDPKTGIALINELRSTLGAIQNRLEHTISNVDTISENMQAAESRIRDVDMAKEMMAFTTSNILNQAATAMLAQANQAPQTVLSLLR